MIHIENKPIGECYVVVRDPEPSRREYKVYRARNAAGVIVSAVQDEAGRYFMMPGKAEEYAGRDCTIAIKRFASPAWWYYPLRRVEHVQHEEEAR